MSSFPFVSGCLSTSLWLRYGFLIQDRSLILVNTVGATLFFAYIVTFYLYSIKKVIYDLQKDMTLKTFFLDFCYSPVCRMFNVSYNNITIHTSCRKYRYR